ncbi:spt2 chromatin protein [Fusarium austroafricanum]|uniref:Spt2 chromatin protein n=1 Tax=Fusarium austroafricanum TaxID=2364996 RepID=A0A8H4KPN4_9HYPO|nr:spt2 chromatin protein [Fusarium austroafricanum]
MALKIGDLLAQISGGDEGSSAPPTPTLARSNTLPKRKADDDPRSNISKAPRVTTLSSSVAPRTTQSPTTSSRPNPPSRPADRPTPSQRPLNSTNGGSKPSLLSSKPMNGAHRVSKPAAPSRPSPGPSSASSAPPKKGSFAEILARAQKAQQSMGQVGKIQHKKVEGGTMKKVKDDPPAKVDPRGGKTLKGRPTPAASGYTGTAKPGQRNGTAVFGRDPRNGKALPPPKAERGRVTGAKAPGGRGAPPEEEPKKVKKAAMATTGYTGTARPRPGGDVSKKKDAPRGGALLSAPRAPRPSRSKSRYDDYDEDMDDFIDYDDEEDVGPRYDYASDGSSDMEAGMDDIDDEERQAERLAKLEDRKEEQLEKKLKAEKEARKRAALEELRTGRRR